MLAQQDFPTPSPTAILTDSGPDWSYIAEQAVAGLLGLVPEAGAALSALVYIFWPQSGQDVWTQIEQQVEQLVNQKIDALVFQQTQDALTGLNNALTDYLDAVKTGDTTNISTQWIATKTIFDSQLPHFQSNGYQLLLLPLFAQYANLYLSLMRDGVLFGSSWGWTPAYQQSTATHLTAAVTSFTSYSDSTYQQGYQNVVNSTGANNHACQPFRAVNTYVRQMTLTVQDFRNMWQYFDASQYPNPVQVYLAREIYSDPVGTCDDSGAINLPSAPTQPISQLVVWAWDRIDAVQLSYPAGGGPGGTTQTPRMGDQGGGSNQPPHGAVLNLSSANPITTAAGTSGDILNSFSFTFQDGSSTGTLGGNYPGGGNYSFSYPNEILSSVHINGISNYYGSADCAVFGFKYPQTVSQAQHQALLRLHYITAPTDSSAVALTEAGMAEVSTRENWVQHRQAYWQHISSQAEQHKQA